MTRTPTKTPRSPRAADAGKSKQFSTKDIGSRATIWQVVALVAIACVAYHNSLWGPFIFDDVMNIRNNFQLRRLWPIWETMWGPLGTGVAGRPVVQLSFALHYALHGLTVTGYHVTNLALHVATALVLYAVLRRTLTSPRLEPHFGRDASFLSFLAAVVWQVHPLLSDSVTYLSGRTEILGALFMLLTLYGAIRARASTTFRGRRAWQATAVVSCALGTGCKEILVAAPFLVFLYEWLFTSAPVAAGPRPARLSPRGEREDAQGVALRLGVLFYLALFATLALIPFNLYMANFHRSALVTQEHMSSWQYLKIQSEVLVLYLRLSLWPHPLIIDYAGWPTDRTLVQVLPSAAVIVALLMATIYLIARRRSAGYAGAWFFLILAPTSSLLPLPTEIATERRMYLPLMGIVALVVLGLNRLIARLRANSFGPRMTDAAVATAAVLLPVVGAEIYRTVVRNEMYKDPIALWTDVVQRRPMNPRAYDNLAYEYNGVGRFDKAKAAWQKAVELNPGNYIGLNNLATMYMKDGNDGEAIARLEAALRVKPDYASPHFNLGRIAYNHGDFATAERELREALRLQDDRDNRVLLAKILIAQDNAAEAEALARSAVRMDPASLSAHDALALALARGGKAREALAESVAVAQASPEDPEYQSHLAWLLATGAGDPSLRKTKQAVAIAELAVGTTKSRDARALDALALALAADGQFDAAAAKADLALQRVSLTEALLVPRLQRRLKAYQRHEMPLPGDQALLP
jgi:tetratricopeptide (TPR) repeat protein